MPTEKTEKIEAANALLASYAVPHQGLLGREHEDPDDDPRFPFQKDRARILRSQAFRRLNGKTQVLLARGEGDHHRNRLTHTLEVSLLARDAAHALKLNQDLCECIAYAHDLGHPPYGHLGETVVDSWMRGKGFSFEHNEQTLRIVEVLETHAGKYLGLNLNREVCEGLQKHADKPHYLESEVVNIVDNVAYNAHDPEDGLRAGLFSLEDMKELALIGLAEKRRAERGTSLSGALIHLLLEDLYRQSAQSLQRGNIHTIADVLADTRRLIGFSEAMQQHLNQLGKFLHENMYFHPQITQKNHDVEQMLTGLLDHFFQHPNQHIQDIQTRTKAELPVAVKDYVAGMTESYAADTYNSL